MPTYEQVQGNILVLAPQLILLVLLLIVIVSSRNTIIQAARFAKGGAIKARKIAKGTARFTVQFAKGSFQIAKGTIRFINFISNRVTSIIAFLSVLVLMYGIISLSLGATGTLLVTNLAAEGVGIGLGLINVLIALNLKRGQGMLLEK